jgi:uncharacterized LabA/DUF88 family protein
MPNVAAFIDYENIHYTALSDYGRYPDADEFAKLLTDITRDRGVCLRSRAYADWKYFQDMQEALDAYGCRPIFVASKLRGAPEKGFRKNSSDIQMTIDVMDTLHLRKDIDTYVFFTGDRDFLALISRLRQEGKRTVVCGFPTSMSEDIVRAAHESVLLDTYLKGWAPLVKPKKPKVKGEPDEWVPLIRRIARLDRLPVIYWHYLRKVMYWDDLEPTPQTRTEKDNYLNRAKMAGIIHTERVANPGPNKDRFPHVTAVTLNTDHPLVQKVRDNLGKTR